MVKETRRRVQVCTTAFLASWLVSGFGAVSAQAASSLYLPTFGVFAPGQEALFVTEYAGGLVRMTKGVVADITEPAFAAPGARWTLDRGLTVVSNVPVFRRLVGDVPDDAKGHLFFALRDDGHLVLYEGAPVTGTVVRDFGRLDTARAGRGLPQGTLEGLRRGVRIDGREDYLSVLSTYGEYLN
ncbi:MAG: BofC C-terminal domain-containing protein [Alicyclobacillaceae bacterium]|nr:BofC C-terminal domain-containing protein [Alicyclobacillaceae bacterium]